MNHFFGTLLCWDPENLLRLFQVHSLSHGLQAQLSLGARRVELSVRGCREGWWWCWKRRRQWEGDYIPEGFRIKVSKTPTAKEPGVFRPGVKGNADSSWLQRHFCVWEGRQGAAGRLVGSLAPTINLIPKTCTFSPNPGVQLSLPSYLCISPLSSLPRGNESRIPDFGFHKVGDHYHVWY